MGSEERSDGVGIFIAEKWVDSVVSVERHSKRVLILKVVLDSGLLNVITDLCSSLRETGGGKRVFGTKCSIRLVVYKGKGDPVECRSYRGIKLLEHAMKVVEKIFEHRIRQQIDIDDMQLGFVKGKVTTDAIFVVRQMQEKFRAKEKKLYFGFVDFEKAFDRVPREVI